jgi:hypothetical protein
VITARNLRFTPYDAHGLRAGAVIAVPGGLCSKGHTMALQVEIRRAAAGIKFERLLADLAEFLNDHVSRRARRLYLLVTERVSRATVLLRWRAAADESAGR